MNEKTLVIGAIAGAYPKKLSLQRAIYGVIHGEYSSAYAAEVALNLPPCTVSRAVKKAKTAITEAKKLAEVVNHV